jgi:hypothetical protein
MSPNLPPRSDWVHRPEGDLFSKENLDAVRMAFRRANGVVFGWHYFYAGGSSRSTVVFTALDQYLHHIERASPGDIFTLYELDPLLDRAVVLLGDRHSTGPLVLREPVVGLADEDAPLLIVRRFVGPLIETVDATATQLLGTSDERQVEFEQALLWGRGELALFDERVLDRRSVAGSNAAQRGRPAHALVEAVRPSAEGTVPVSGPY